MGAAKVVANSNAYATEVDIQHSAGYSCFDQCTWATTQVEWVSSCAGDKDTTAQFNMLKPGTYYLKYRCYDAALNEATACRTFQNVDKDTTAQFNMLKPGHLPQPWYYHLHQRRPLRHHRRPHSL